MWHGAAGAFIPLTHVKSPLKSLFWKNKCILFLAIVDNTYYLQMIEQKNYGLTPLCESGKGNLYLARQILAR